MVVNCRPACNARNRVIDIDPGDIGGQKQHRRRFVLDGGVLVRALECIDVALFDLVPPT
jgi:hypothetical protein